MNHRPFSAPFSKIATFVLTLALLFSPSCAHVSNQKDNQSADQTFGDVVILATTDFHATVDKAEALATTIRSLQKKYQGHTVTVSAGDLFQGSIEGNSSKGKAIIDLFNVIPMTAVAMGNHDIDHGPARKGSIVPRKGEHPRGALLQRVKESKFPWLSANVVYKKGKTPQRNAFKNAMGKDSMFAAHHILNIANAKVCIIGATTPSTPYITLPAFVQDLDFLPLKESVEAEAQFLRNKEACDSIILVVHAGLVCKDLPARDATSSLKNTTAVEQGRCLEHGDLAEILPLLQALPEGTIDAVVSGHTHIKAEETIHSTPVLEAAPYGKGVGAIHLKIDPVSHKSKFIKFEQFDTSQPVAGIAPPPVADVTKAMAPYRKAAEEMKAQHIGKVTAPFLHNYKQESALANAVAQALQKSAPALNVGIMNAGGVRASIQGPEVNFNDVFKTLPFDNHLATIKNMKGSELRRLIEIGVSGAHGGPGFAGLNVVAYQIPPEQDGPWMRDLNGDGKKEQWERNVVVSINVAKTANPNATYEPLRDNATYNVGTIDFLVSGGDHQKVVYDKIEKSHVKVYYNLTTRDAFGDFLSHYKNGLNPDDFLSPTKRRVQWIPYSEKLNKN